MRGRSGVVAALGLVVIAAACRAGLGSTPPPTGNPTPTFQPHRFEAAR